MVEPFVETFFVVGGTYHSVYMHKDVHNDVINTYKRVREQDKQIADLEEIIKQLGQQLSYRGDVIRDLRAQLEK